MKDAIRNLIFLSILLFSISYDSFVVGVAYDKKYKLHAELSDYYAYSCWLAPSVYEYGNRWIRLGNTCFALSLVISLTTFVVAVREEKRTKIASFLVKEK